ncbi:hypothetical protein HS088_TW18G00492 [Tripterygium wilfordii]|uniref:Uncharacterized protein n=1 Tax=Tripterygium wilfordii TaxID=458696 RepID=A0A7J7CD49_TRIWF|nr:hypothetical protein HS088_TW18G00492 [Tripterygium wilfordii]
MKLKRNSSVSSSSSSSAIKYAVNRAFSMGRSSSVTERYSKIHDQPLNSTSPFTATIDEGDDDNGSTVETLKRTRSVKQTKKSSSRGKILEGCSNNETRERLG